jgi:hypothetical protein
MFFFHFPLKIGESAHSLSSLHLIKRVHSFSLSNVRLVAWLLEPVFPPPFDPPAAASNTAFPKKRLLKVDAPALIRISNSQLCDATEASLWQEVWCSDLAKYLWIIPKLRRIRDEPPSGANNLEYAEEETIDERSTEGEAKALVNDDGELFSLYVPSWSSTKDGEDNDDVKLAEI